MKTMPTVLNEMIRGHLIEVAAAYRHDMAPWIRSAEWSLRCFADEYKFDYHRLRQAAMRLA